MAQTMGLALLLFAIIPLANGHLASLMSQLCVKDSATRNGAAFAIAPHLVATSSSFGSPHPAVNWRPSLAPVASSTILAPSSKTFASNPVVHSITAWQSLVKTRRVGFGILAARMDSRESKTRVTTSQSVGHKVLVLNASFEPLSVVSATRALSMIWDNKALQVVAHSKKWTSCSGLQVDVPSVVCLRRYVKVHPKYPTVNRRTVLMRDHGICQYCGQLAENVDHVIPRSRGGTNHWDNVVASCAPCNNKKADKMLKDCGMKLKKPPQLPSPVSWVHSVVWKIDHRWKPYIGDWSWQDVEAMWKGTKMEKKRLANKKALTSGEKTSSTKAGKRKTTSKSSAVPKSEVDQVVEAYTPTATS